MSSREAYLLGEIERLQAHLNAHLLDEALHGHVNRYQPAQNVPRHGEGQHTNRTVVTQFLPATLFASAVGAPSLVDNDDNRQSWALDPASDEGVSGAWAVPGDWVAATAVNFYIVWTVNSVNTGNVSWRVRRSVWVSEGQSTAAAVNQDATDAALGVANQEVMTAAFASTPDAAGERLYIGVQRRGSSDVNDTLNSDDAQFLGVLVEYNRDH